MSLPAAGTLSVEKSKFGQLSNGQTVDRYILRNANGLSVSVITYGGIITQLNVPDRNGNNDSIVLGFDNLQSYLTEHPYFGAVVGRFANRIGGARFRLNGQEYNLAANNGSHSLHGGLSGFDKKLWKADAGIDLSAARVSLSYTSLDMEEGFPGNLQVKVVYSLDNDNALTVSYEAVADKSTPVNLTNHSYFNLAGAGSGDVLGHWCHFYSDLYTPVDSELIPTGEILSVKNTVFDFTEPVSIGSRLHGGMIGFDHNFVIRRAGETISTACFIWHDGSGRTMLVQTDQPGFQFYTGNFLDDTISGIGGKYGKHGAFCIETQHFPDSPNKSHFPDVILHPGRLFQSVTRYVFGLKQEHDFKPQPIVHGTWSND